MRNAPCRTWNMARKLKITKCPLWDMEYGKKTESWKMRHIHLTT
uniref:Uncharacterized protein n=1 Tax=Trichinella nativa TaxID=6335 RepID=A0A0V1KHD8_9BILA